MIHSKFAKFLFLGLPAFLIAIPLNYFFVEIIELEKILSYFLVMVFQVILNFLITIKFIFFKRGGYTQFNFLVFLSIVLSVRFFDWYLYGLLIKSLDFHFIIIQITNVGFFSYIKFILLKKYLKAV